MTSKEGWFPPSHQLNSHRLPEGEEDHSLDNSKLGKWSDRVQLLLGGLEHEHQAIQCPSLREIIDDGGVNVWVPEVQASVASFSGVESCGDQADSRHEWSEDDIIQNTLLALPEEVNTHWPGVEEVVDGPDVRNVFFGGEVGIYVTIFIIQVC